jgi:hypothetical protein
VRVEQRAARERDRHGVHAEVAMTEVLIDGGALERGHVARPPSIGGHRAPGAEGLRQPEDGAAGADGHGARHLLGLAGHREVHVADRAAEERIADRSAHDPHVRRAAQRLTNGDDRSSRAQGVIESSRTHAPQCTRGTRGPIPQVTS